MNLDEKECEVMKERGKFRAFVEFRIFSRFEFSGEIQNENVHTFENRDEFKIML